MASDTCSYVVLVAGGLESVASELISSSLGVPVAHILQPPGESQWAVPPPSPRDLVFTGEAGFAKLRFELPRPTDQAGWAAQHAAIAALPCTCGLLAPLATAHNISLDASVGPRQVSEAMDAAMDETWASAIAQWRYLRASPPNPGEPTKEARVGTGDGGGGGSSGGGSSGGGGDDTLSGLSFRGSALRDGKHAFKSVQVAEAVGSAVGRRFPQLKVDLEEFDLEVVAILLQVRVGLGLGLGLDAGRCKCRCKCTCWNPRIA